MNHSQGNQYFCARIIKSRNTMKKQAPETSAPKWCETQCYLGSRVTFSHPGLQNHVKDEGVNTLFARFEHTDGRITEDSRFANSHKRHITSNTSKNLGHVDRNMWGESISNNMTYIDVLIAPRLNDKVHLWAPTVPVCCILSRLLSP